MATRTAETCRTHGWLRPPPGRRSMLPLEELNLSFMFHGGLACWKGSQVAPLVGLGIDLTRVKRYSPDFNFRIMCHLPQDILSEPCTQIKLCKPNMAQDAIACRDDWPSCAAREGQRRPLRSVVGLSSPQNAYLRPTGTRRSDSSATGGGTPTSRRTTERTSCSGHGAWRSACSQCTRVLACHKPCEPYTLRQGRSPAQESSSNLVAGTPLPIFGPGSRGAALAPRSNMFKNS